jgi:hypothetical protein
MCVLQNTCYQGYTKGMLQKPAAGAEAEAAAALIGLKRG